MPGPKFPVGYDQIWHDIAAKLLIERPVRMTVTLPSMNITHARATFNYFRQSWLRQYQFLQKGKDLAGAMAALDSYHRLCTYKAQISPPHTLILTSKQAETEGVVIETEGHISSTHKDWAPHAIERMEKKFLQPQESDFKAAQEAQDRLSSTGYVSKHERKAVEASPDMEKEEQIIPDNPGELRSSPIPPSPQAQQLRDSFAFSLSIGRPPNSSEELAHWLAHGDLPG